MTPPGLAEAVTAARIAAGGSLPSEPGPDLAGLQVAAATVPPSSARPRSTPGEPALGVARMRAASLGGSPKPAAPLERRLAVRVVLPTAEEASAP
ncbi:hypothetical protein [Flindersiella endophytica]